MIFGLFTSEEISPKSLHSGPPVEWRLDSCVDVFLLQLRDTLEWDRAQGQRSPCLLFSVEAKFGHETIKLNGILLIHSAEVMHPSKERTSQSQQFSVEGEPLPLTHTRTHILYRPGTYLTCSGSGLWTPAGAVCLFVDTNWSHF